MGTPITLPSGKSVEITELNGKTERMIQDKRFIQSDSFSDKYLAARIASIDGNDKLTPREKEDAVLDMYAGDRNYLLYQIRLDSYGPDMTFKYECPSCGRTSGYYMNLREALDDGTIKIIPYRDEPLRVDLPRCGGYAVVGCMTGREAKKIRQLKDFPISGRMLIRVSELNGKPPTREAMDELIGEDLAIIRGAISEMDNAGLIPSIELKCLECGRDYSAALPSIPDFFMPKMTSMDSVIL
jgi:hypothetical protein